MCQLTVSACQQKLEFKPHCTKAFLCAVCMLTMCLGGFLQICLKQVMIVEVGVTCKNGMGTIKYICLFSVVVCYHVLRLHNELEPGTLPERSYLLKRKISLITLWPNLFQKHQSNPDGLKAEVFRTHIWHSYNFKALLPIFD